MNTKAFILLLGALCATSSTLDAQHLRATRSLPLLEYAQSARTAALGGNHYAESDVSQLYTNPTSLLYGQTVFSVGAGMRSLGKLEGIEGANNLYKASLGVAVGQHAFFGGVRYLGGLKYAPIDNNEHVKPKLRTLRDCTVDLGYALRLGLFSGYAKGSYVYTDQGSAATTMVFGAGAFFRSSDDPASTGLDFTLGAKVDNLGPKYKQSAKSSAAYAPAYAGAGGEVRYGIEGEHRLSLGAGVDYFFAPQQAASTTIHLGGEYLYHQMVAFRGGYQYDTNGVKGLSAGLGLRFKGVALDATYLAPSSTVGKSSLWLTAGLSI